MIDLHLIYILAEKEVKEIIHNLHTVYRRELTKVNKSKTLGKSVDEIYKPKWQHYDLLEFIQPMTNLRSTVSNLMVR